MMRRLSPEELDMQVLGKLCGVEFQLLRHCSASEAVGSPIMR